MQIIFKKRDSFLKIMKKIFKKLTLKRDLLLNYQKKRKRSHENCVFKKKDEKKIVYSLAERMINKIKCMYYENISDITKSDKPQLKIL